MGNPGIILGLLNYLFNKLLIYDLLMYFRLIIVTAGVIAYGIYNNDFIPNNSNCKEEAVQAFTVRVKGWIIRNKRIVRIDFYPSASDLLLLTYL